MVQLLRETAAKEATPAHNPGSSALRADIDPFFSTSQVGAWVTLPWGVYAGWSPRKRSCQGQHDEFESGRPLKLEKYLHDAGFTLFYNLDFLAPQSQGCFEQIWKQPSWIAPPQAEAAPWVLLSGSCTSEMCHQMIQSRHYPSSLW